MRIQHCLNALSKAIGADGDIIELGVASGALTFPLADYVKWHNKYVNRSENKKRVFACDTFSGLPYDDCAEFPESHKKGEFNYGENFKIIRSQRVDLPIITIEGLVEETLELSFKDHKFCFAFLDMDLYSPTSFAVKFFASRIAIGGMLGFHDYHNPKTPGIDRIIEKELDRDVFAEVFNKDSCAFFVKTREPVPCFL